MQHEQTSLEDHLTREELQALRNRRTGMTLFQLSWIMAFVCLIIVNWQLRFQYTQWPPEGVEAMGLALPTVATVALLASVWTVRDGLLAMQQDARGRFLSRWLITLGLGAVFVGIMAVEWLRAPTGTQYGSLFRFMTAFHTVHALAIGMYLLHVIRQARHGHYGARDSWAVEAGAKLWYFVAVAWMLFYAVLYWI